MNESRLNYNMKSWAKRGVHIILTSYGMAHCQTEATQGASQVSNSVCEVFTSELLWHPNSLMNQKGNWIKTEIWRVHIVIVTQNKTKFDTWITKMKMDYGPNHSHTSHKYSIALQHKPTKYFAIKHTKIFEFQNPLIKTMIIQFNYQKPI